LFKLRGGNSYSSSKLLCLLWRWVNLLFN
jgi:hypothetical protein